jgi:hypothetical protein
LFLTEKLRIRVLLLQLMIVRVLVLLRILITRVATLRVFATLPLFPPLGCHLAQAHPKGGEQLPFLFIKKKSYLPRQRRGDCLWQGSSYLLRHCYKIRIKRREAVPSLRMPAKSYGRGVAEGEENN